MHENDNRLPSANDTGPSQQGPSQQGHSHRRHSRRGHPHWPPAFSRTALVLSAGLLAAGLAATVHFYRLKQSIDDSFDPSPPSRPLVNAPFITTPQDVVEKMLEVAALGENDLVYDLGCGDGRIVVTAARKYGCRAVGYDIESERVEESRENVKKNGVEQLVTIEQAEIFTLDLSPANVITMYLLPRLNVKLIPQLEKLAPGTRIVSHDFDIKGVTPDEVIYFTSQEDQREHTLYLWTTPFKKGQD